MTQPKDLWIGIGCQHQTARAVFDYALQQVCQTYAISLDRIAGLATLGLKATEPGLRSFSLYHQWPVVYFTSAELQTVRVPHPSAQVQTKLGLASVAEAAALKAADPSSGQATLLVPKQVYRCAPTDGAVTWAIAQTITQIAENETA